MNEFINSLDISIKDPYYGMEIKPDYIPYSDEASKFWNDQVCCLLPFELNLYRYKENNEKGYVFATKPCACYDIIPNTYKIVTDDLNKLLLFDKLKEVKEKILNDDYSLCKNCPEYQSYKNKTTKFEPGIRLYELYGFYGRKIYEGHLNKRYNSVMDNPLTLKLYRICHDL